MRTLQSRSLLVLHILLMLVSSISMAQVWDFNTWHDIKFGGDLTKNLSASIDQQLRLEENSTRVDQTFTELGLKYDLPKGFKAAVAYRLSWVADRDMCFESRHRYIVDLGYGRKVWRLRPELRARFQHRPSVSAFSESAKPEESSILVRLKFGVSYAGLKDWKPGVEFEAFIRTNHPLMNGFIAYRYRASLQYGLPKRQAISVFYLLETDYSRITPQFTSILGIDYSYEWKLPKKKKKKNKDEE